MRQLVLACAARLVPCRRRHPDGQDGRLLNGFNAGDTEKGQRHLPPAAVHATEGQGIHRHPRPPPRSGSEANIRICEDARVVVAIYGLRVLLGQTFIDGARALLRGGHTAVPVTNSRQAGGVACEDDHSVRVIAAGAVRSAAAISAAGIAGGHDQPAFCCVPHHRKSAFAPEEAI